MPHLPISLPPSTLSSAPLPTLLHTVASSDDERSRLFMRIWTLKEAFVKCRGVGINAPPGFSVGEGQGHPPPVGKGIASASLLIRSCSRMPSLVSQSGSSVSAELGQPLALALGGDPPASLSVCGLALARGDRPLEITLSLAGKGEAAASASEAGRRSGSTGVSCLGEPGSSSSSNSDPGCGGSSSSSSNSISGDLSLQGGSDTRWKFLLVQPRWGAGKGEDIEGAAGCVGVLHHPSIGSFTACCRPLIPSPLIHPLTPPLERSPDHVAAICVEDPPGWRVGGEAATNTESTAKRRAAAAGEEPACSAVTSGEGSGQDRAGLQPSSLLTISMSRCVPLLWGKPMMMTAQPGDQPDAFVLGCSL